MEIAVQIILWSVAIICMIFAGIFLWIVWHGYKLYRTTKMITEAVQKKQAQTLQDVLKKRSN